LSFPVVPPKFFFRPLSRRFVFVFFFGYFFHDPFFNCEFFIELPISPRSFSLAYFFGFCRHPFFFSRGEFRVPTALRPPNSFQLSPIAFLVFFHFLPFHFNGGIRASSFFFLFFWYVVPLLFSAFFFCFLGFPRFFLPSQAFSCPGFFLLTLFFSLPPFSFPPVLSPSEQNFCSFFFPPAICPFVSGCSPPPLKATVFQ